jgi:hypothetical protein
MKLDSALVREPSDRALPPQVFVPQRSTMHTPRTRFRLRLRSPEDVRVARSRGVPVYLLDTWVVEALGNPRNRKPRLMVARDLLPVIDSPYATVSFASRDAVVRPRLEDVVVALLHYDKLGARQVARRHRARLDPNRLLKRVFEEGLEGPAYRVRLDDFSPSLPRTGTPLTREELLAEDSAEHFRKLPL